MAIYGTAGADSLTGTSGADEIFGLGGHDTLRGVAGADWLYGESGDDSLIGGSGDDQLSGGDGNDSLFGGLGKDTLFGGAGNDILDGGGWNDHLDGGTGFDIALYSVNTTPIAADLTLGSVSFPGQSWAAETLISIEGIVSGSGADTLRGSSSDNLLSGGAGDDRLSGLGGADSLFGGDGRDWLNGGDGDDTLDGGLGDDRLHGRGGDDVLKGGGGHDYLNGGSGSDTVVYDQSRYDDEGIEYGPELDPWHVEVNLLEGMAHFIEPGYASEKLDSIENVVTANGDDSLVGSHGANRLDAGDGINLILGKGGDDTLLAGDASSENTPGWVGLPAQPGAHSQYGDYIDGGGGDDYIAGGGSFRSVDYRGDTILGHEVLRGGAGNDTLVAGFGDIELTGGTGADHFVFTDEVRDLTVNGDYDRYWTERGVITDFNRAQGDKIVVDLNAESDLFYSGSFDSDLPYVFKGQAADEAREWGWFRDGADTVARFNVVDAEVFQSYQQELLSVDIRLAGYTGSLTMSDFEFV